MNSTNDEIKQSTATDGKPPVSKSVCEHNNLINKKKTVECPLCSSNNVDINFNHYNYCRDCNHDWAK